MNNHQSHLFHHLVYVFSKHLLLFFIIFQYWCHFQYSHNAMNRVFHNNIFFSDDIGDLRIIDHTHITHSDFFLEFLGVIFIAAWHHCKFTPESEQRRSQNALDLPIIAQLAHVTPLSLCFLIQGSRFRSWFRPKEYQ